MNQYIKYGLIYTFINFITLIGFTSGYQWEWFLQYNESAGKIHFNCKQQCTIILWQKNKIDYLDINWNVEWNGSIRYEFYIWNEVYLSEEYNIENSSKIEKYVNFIEKEYSDYIPLDANLRLFVNWDTSWELYIKTWKFLLWYAFHQWWKDFRKMETIKENSINLHDWIMINWESITEYWYILFIIVALCILLSRKLSKKQKFRIIFYVWLWIFLFIWVRNIISYTYILIKWLPEFKEKREFYYMWDYIWFMEKIRDNLELDSKKNKDNCKIFINEFEDRGSLYGKLYLVPCEVVSTEESANYIIYYKTDVQDKDQNKRVLIDFNGSYLLDNNLK